jgi:hypothetical protein
MMESNSSIFRVEMASTAGNEAVDSSDSLVITYICILFNDAFSVTQHEIASNERVISE